MNECMDTYVDYENRQMGLNADSVPAFYGQSADDYGQGFGCSEFQKSTGQGFSSDEKQVPLYDSARVTVIPVIPIVHHANWYNS